MFGVELATGARLRLFEERDAKELAAAVDRDRERLGAWMPWAPANSLATSLAFIRGTQRQLATDDGFQTAIVRDQRIVGAIGFHRVDWSNRATSLGYWLVAAEEGRGTMTAAAGALTDHALRSWRLSRVEIRAAIGNARSRAVPQRLGYRSEGTLRNAERIGDRWVDHVVYAMLSADWSWPPGRREAA